MPSPKSGVIPELGFEAFATTFPFLEFPGGLRPWAGFPDGKSLDSWFAAEFTAFINSEIPRWGRLVRISGITSE